MAGIKPGFVSGANARVKLDGKTLAYCTDLNYTVDMATIPIEAIGSYEVKSYEPIAYSVNGSFSVIRYTQHILPESGSTLGNPAVQLGDSNTVGVQLDPGRVLSSTSFDMEIYQSTAGTTTTGIGATGADTSAPNSIFKIHDCRVTRRSSALNKRGVMVDSYTFVGILASDTDVPAGAEISTSGSKIKDLS